MKAELIKNAVAHYFKKKLWFVNYEVGLCKGGRLRADVVAVNMGSQIAVIEVKSSVSDFKTDKKMAKYVPFADKTYVACDSPTYAKIKDLILPGLGVFLVSSSGKARVIRRPKAREVKPEIRLNIITRLAYRTGDTLHDRKSRHEPANFIASKAVDAILDIPLKERKGREYVTSMVAKALKNHV